MCGSGLRGPLTFAKLSRILRQTLVEMWLTSWIHPRAQRGPQHFSNVTRGAVPYVRRSKHVLWLAVMAGWGVALQGPLSCCTQAPCQQVRSHENHIPNPICPRSYKTSDSRNARKTFAKKKILSRSPSRSFRGGSWMVPNGRPLHIVKQGPLDQLSYIYGPALEYAQTPPGLFIWGQH